MIAMGALSTATTDCPFHTVVIDTVVIAMRATLAVVHLDTVAVITDHTEVAAVVDIEATV